MQDISEQVMPFRVDVPAEVLHDLQLRLNEADWVVPTEGLEPTTP